MKKPDAKKKFNKAEMKKLFDTRIETLVKEAVSDNLTQVRLLNINNKITLLKSIKKNIDLIHKTQKK